MTVLADILDLMHRSPKGWRTLQLAGTTSMDEVYSRWSTEVAHAQGLGDSQPGEPRIRTRRWRLWCRRPIDVRFEFDDDKGETTHRIRKAATWWLWSERRGMSTNEGGGAYSNLSPMAEECVVSPAWFLPLIAIDSFTRDVRQSRQILSIKARPRSASLADSYRLRQVGLMGDRLELVIDVATRVAVHCSAWWGDRLVGEVSVDDLTTDEGLPRGTFSVPAIPPPPDPVHLDLNELSSRVPFTLLVPEHPDINGPFPFSWIRPTYFPPGSKFGDNSVSLLYELRDEDGPTSSRPGQNTRSVWLKETSGQLPETPPHDWDQIHEVWVKEGLGPGAYKSYARYAAHGTVVNLHSSELDTNALAEFARTLVPLDRELPKLEEVDLS